MLKAMLERAKQARATELEGDEAAEAGFTLIELMVVLLIMGILMAIAIPTFLGVVGGANNTSAQSNLTNALTEATALYQSSNQTFPASAASYQSSAPEFTWHATSSVTTGNYISIDPSSDGQAIILADESKATDGGSSTGTCWYVLYTPNESPGTAYGTTAFTGSVVTGSGSSASTAAIATAGTYYAKSKATATPGCAASHAVGFATWYPSFGAVSADG